MKRFLTIFLQLMACTGLFAAELQADPPVMHRQAYKDSGDSADSDEKSSEDEEKEKSEAASKKIDKETTSTQSSD